MAFKIALTAHKGAVFILFTELDGKKDLGILGRHTKQENTIENIK